jgi:hypothetical protein
MIGILQDPLVRAALAAPLRKKWPIEPRRNGCEKTYDRKSARCRLPGSIFDAMDGAAESEITLRDNTELQWLARDGTTKRARDGH